MNFLYRNIFTILWLLSSFIITLLSYFFKSKGPVYHGGIYYIIFIIVYSLFVFSIKESIKDYKIKLSPVILIIGIIPILFTSPLFENDHYRYIFEGKVISHFENPYLKAPNHTDLLKIDFEHRESIGFAHLTTVYPPLGPLFFSLVSSFKFSYALKILMLLNSLLVIYWFKLLMNFKIRNEYLLLCIPYLQKEFIGAVHIDLLASIFLILFIGPLKSYRSYSSYFLSYWTKILGIISLPFLFLYDIKINIKNKQKILLKAFLVILISLSLPLFFYFFIPNVEDLKGVITFSKYWVWNAGFYNLLELFPAIDLQKKRLICFVSYILFYMGTIIWFYKKSDRKKLENDFFKANLLIYSGLMFFSPVYNGWYAIWFLPYALILNNKWGIFYAIFSAFSYLAYGHMEWRYYGHLICHSFFILLLIDFIKLKSNSNTCSN